MISSLSRRMSRSLKAVSVSLLVLASAVAPQAAQASPAAASAPVPSQGPGLWVVRDADSTIYIFGTFHYLPRDMTWRSARIDQAFAESDDIYFELPSMDMSYFAPVLAELAMAAPGQGLSTVLTPQEQALLDRVAARLGTTAAAMEPLRPWWAWLTVGAGAVVLEGYGPEAGADTILKAMAVEQGKPVRGFETAHRQMSYFANLPVERQVDALRFAMEKFDETPGVTAAMSRAWLSGDQEALETLVVDELKSQGEWLYEAMLVHRNRDWSEQILRILQGSGVTFVAVGGGHLVGEDGVLALLEKGGATVERL